MKLSSYFGQVNQTVVGNTGIENSPAMEQGLRNGMEAIMGKLPGQSITGEVLLKEGNDVLLSLGRNQLLQAKLDGGMSAMPGQLLTFQIKNNTSSKIVLSPLFENLSQDPNVSKALQAAGIPENSITAGMVRALMQEGLPIDRQSLYQMNRLVNANPLVDMQTLAQMQRLHLPITEENIGQFEAYKNYQHQISGSLADIADALSQTFGEITGSGSISEGLAFYKDVLGILTEGLKEQGVQPDQGNIEGVGKEAGMGAEAMAELKGEGGPLGLTREEVAGLVSHLKQAGMPDKLTAAVAENRIGGQALLHEIEKFLSEGTGFHRESAFELLESKEFKHLLNNEMNRQWLLLPEEVGEEHSVDKLYERLNSQMNRLSQSLAQTAKADTPLARTVANVTNNIDFMNQLNQMFTYVQIPLKMQGREATGELFVYTNKKSLAKKDGSVSALLHLDMEHLGSVDIHVSLNNQKVSTQFYLQDDSALDLIAQNIDILNKRLESRGYSMNAEFVKRENDGGVIDEILGREKNISVLSGYSFDARA